MAVQINDGVLVSFFHQSTSCLLLLLGFSLVVFGSLCENTAEVDSFVDQSCFNVCEGVIYIIYIFHFFLLKQFRHEKW